MKVLALVSVLAIASSSFAQVEYPPTRTVDASDTYFGITYKDPYRWLEDLKDQAVQDWFKSQATVTDDQLTKIRARDALADEWLKLDKLQPAKYNGIAFENGRVFYKKTLGGENVGKLYYRDGWRGAENLLFDPSTFKPKGAKEGDVTTIQGMAASPDGRYVALGFSAAGAEYSEIKIIDVAKRGLLSELVSLVRSDRLDRGLELAALRHGQGPRHQEPRDRAEPQDKITSSARRSPQTSTSSRTKPIPTSDHAQEFDSLHRRVYPDYVIGYVGTVQQEMRLFYAPSSQMKEGKVKWSVLARTTDSLVRGLAFHGDQVFAVTHGGAPRYKLVRTSVKNPDWSKAETVLPEATDSIQYIAKSKSFLFVVYSDGITGRIVKHDLTSGRDSAVKLPASGSVDINCPDFRTNQCIVFTTSWIQPTTLWDFDADEDTFAKSIFNTAVSYPGFENLITEEVEAQGHDGTMVPLSIIRRKDMKLDGSSTAILEGYGAYGISYTPGFNVRHSLALHGVVLGYCHPRGGSEKGEAWYKAGYKSTKPNTWKDFIACAEYLTRTATPAPASWPARLKRRNPHQPRHHRAAELFGAAICNVGA
jgi:prolyl oligopeptidase